MKNFRLLTFVLVAVIAFSSCNSLEKMKKNHPDVSYKVVPEVLKEQGGEVEVAITGTFPEKYLNKKANVEITPVIVYSGGEKALKPVIIQGEKVMGNNQVITNDGGSFSYTDKVPFEEGMRKSELVLRVRAFKDEKKEVYFDDMKVADGVIATSTYVLKMAQPIIMPDKYQRIVAETKTADLMFLINRANIRSSQMKSDDMKALKEFVKLVQATENLEFTGTEISAYASPDGALDLNTKLSEKRAVTSKQYLDRELKRAKIEEAKNSDFVSTKTTAEDWDGFQKLMAESNIQDKDLILRVLSMYSDPAVREKEIKNIAAAYKEIAKDILPLLRRSKIDVNINRIGLSDEEIMQYIKSKGDTLGIEEILYAATLTEDNGAKAKIYSYGLNRYPKCVRAANNLGVIQMNEGNYEEAKASFEKAQGLYDNDAVKNNLGYASLVLGDNVKAKEYFTSVGNPGKETNDGLGILAIIDGNYQDASNYFGSATSYNAALAKVLNGDDQGAKTMLDGITHDCYRASYLKGIVGAHLEDETYMWDNLKKAIELNPDMKAVLATDMEFGKYYADDKFAALVK